MTNTYNTLNPLGSTSAKDLSDNASNFDEGMNSLSPSFYDRFKRRRETWAGMEKMVSDFLEAMGFEATHLVYVDGTPMTVLRPTQLIDRAGSVYKVKQPASFPVVLSGTWATDQLLLVDVGDGSLRAALALATGAGMVGFSGSETYALNTVGATLKEVDRRIDFEVHFDDFSGVVGDDANDDTAGMQAAILAVATAGGGTVRGSAGKKYYIPGTLLTSSNVTIDFGGAIIRSNRAGGTNATFATATLEGGVLVDNRAAADDIKLVEFAHITNLRAKDAHCLFDFKNWIIGCSVSNIKTTNCRQVIQANRCFYSRWVNIAAVGGSLSDVPTYHFKDQNNAVYLNRLSATTIWGYAFTGGSSAVHIDTCTYEGGQLGFYVEGENHGFTWTSLYSEAVQGVLFNFSDCTYISYKIQGSYLNYVDVVLRDPEGAGAICEGIWDQSNDLVNVGVTVGGFLYRGLIYKRGARSAASLDLPTSFGAEATLPSNIISDVSGMGTARKISVREGVSAGDVLSKGVLLGGVIPLHYSGDMGRTFANQVAFSSHQKAAGTTVLIDTRIIMRDTVFAKYNVIITDSVGTYNLFGDIYGVHVKQQDSSGKTAVVSTGTNGLRLELGGFSIPGSYTCTGTVQLCT